ncbi:hypothetical protein ACFXG1_05955 [Streptomyces sp. NPDC059248]|uniref:hypothetical protein n=1 Tax=Streptomyces sp. NPDC059248 TaxID=3346791 RepID=UPI0036B7C04F
MNDDIRNIVLGLVAAGLSALIGWLARTYRWRRSLRRTQDFFGLPPSSDALLVVNREAGRDGSVKRGDVFALLELAALIKDCGARAQVIWHDEARQGVGEQAEFCVGGPVSNQRMGAHLRSLLPGVAMDTSAEPGPDRGAFRIGTEVYRAEYGTAEYVLLARLTPGEEGRPVFLLCGQLATANQAAARYLARNHRRLARAHRKGAFCLLLKVVDSAAYGPDVVEVVADVTETARTPRPAVEAGAAGAAGPA